MSYTAASHKGVVQMFTFTRPDYFYCDLKKDQITKPKILCYNSRASDPAANSAILNITGQLMVCLKIINTLNVLRVSANK